MPKITKETLLADILDIAPDSAQLFQSVGMHCFGCPMSGGETLDEACMAHGIDSDELLAHLTTLVK